MGKALAAKLGTDEAKTVAAVSKAREAHRATRPAPGTQTNEQRDKRRAEGKSLIAKQIASDLGVDQAKVEKTIDELRAVHQTDRPGKAADWTPAETANSQGSVPLSPPSGKPLKNR